MRVCDSKIQVLFYQYSFHKAISDGLQLTFANKLPLVQFICPFQQCYLIFLKCLMAVLRTYFSHNCKFVPYKFLPRTILD